MRWIVFVLLISCVPAMAASEISGRASVIDGDTFELAGEKVRLDGVDAPESWQRCTDMRGAEYRCGKASALALDSFLAEARPVRCKFSERDRNGRPVAICWRADGVEVNAWMVRNGFALDWPLYSHGRYAREQKAAASEKAGMWQGAFVEPWEARWSRRHGN
jgi:endonuclease YncB( thermonuclease family)